MLEIPVMEWKACNACGLVDDSVELGSRWAWEANLLPATGKGKTIEGGRIEQAMLVTGIPNPRLAALYGTEGENGGKWCVLKDRSAAGDINGAWHGAPPDMIWIQSHQ